MSELESKIHDAIAGSGFGAVMAVGVDTFSYLTRTVLPFAENYPDRRAAVVLPHDGKGVVLCPVDWSEAVRDQGWGGEICTYDENDGVSPLAFVEALKRILDERDLSNSKIGLDLTRVTKGLMDVLRSELHGIVFGVVQGCLELLDHFFDHHSSLLVGRPEARHLVEPVPVPVPAQEPCSLLLDDVDALVVDQLLPGS